MPIDLSTGSAPPRRRVLLSDIEENNNHNMCMRTDHLAVRDHAGGFTRGCSSSLPPDSHQDGNSGQVISVTDFAREKNVRGFLTQLPPPLRPFSVRLSSPVTSYHTAMAPHLRLGIGPLCAVRVGPSLG